MPKNNTEKIKRERNDLEERLKELGCIHSTSSILKSRDVTFDEVMEHIVNLIPLSLQFPDIACARIVIQGEEYRTPNFSDTEWKDSSDLFAGDEKVGFLEAGYIVEPSSDDPFLEEEKKLISTLGNFIGVFLEENWVKKELKRRSGEFVDDIGPGENSEWQIIIDLLVKTDPRALLRFTRKMMYHIYRMKNQDVSHLLDPICSDPVDTEGSKWCGINVPMPKRDVAALKTIHENVFDIARNIMSNEEITDLLQRWIKEDKVRPLLIASQRRGISLGTINTELKRFCSDEEEMVVSPEDDITIRTALIRRFFTRRLQQINVAKDYIGIGDFVSILKSVIGPAEGEGKLGGKAFGICIAEKILKKELEEHELETLAFPRSWYITSDTVLHVIHFNDLDEFVHVKYMEPRQIRQEYGFLEQVFKNAAFPEEIIGGLRRILNQIGDNPIIVRSSSLLEDSYGSAFSGKYKSLFLTNTGSEEERLYSIVDAVAEVFASTFGPEPMEYRRQRGLLDFSEEMGVIIQEVVGNRMGPYYMPTFSGVAFSNNEFQWSPRIKREDGMLRMVVGLGTHAVDRVGDDYPLIVSPNRPEIRVNTMTDEVIKYSQHLMDVLNLEKKTLETISVSEFLKDHWEEFPLFGEIVSIEKDRYLVPADTIFSVPSEKDMVVTFDRLIEKGDFIQQIDRILSVLKEVLKTPVDVEFAHDGKKLYILQCRPQSQSAEVDRVPIPANVPPSRIVFSANKYVTTGHITDVEYVVYVNGKEYGRIETRENIMRVASAVGRLNESLPKRKFILMGPGRWGSRGDIRLGVPVMYNDINNTSLLVEIAREKGQYTPDLSFGTHFFQDLVEADIRYLPLYPDKKGNKFNEELLLKTENHLEELAPEFSDLKDVIKVVKIGDIIEGGNLNVIMDGDEGVALAFISSQDSSNHAPMQ